MAGMEALYAAQFVIGAASAANQAQVADMEAQEQRRQANLQVAINNRLAYNAHLSLNAQQSLEFSKFGFEKFELAKSIRSERAKVEAIAASFGGSFGQQGGSFDATIINMNRHGSTALARKDFNFKILATNFNTKHENITLQTQSKNNQAFSGLSTGSSPLGTGLQIAGSAINSAVAYETGTR
jgi:hypothetical protein|tara:strand:+ start:58 stop:606 length:549 start_codon:yes stop_codon:yes gene_type:complete